MKAAYLVGAVGTGCALALLYLKSWRKDEETADHSSTGHPEETDEINKNGTSDNEKEEANECESHSFKTCLQNVSNLEDCGSKSHDFIAQKKEGCQKSIIISGDDFRTVTEEFTVTQSVECEELKECVETDYVSCQPVLQENFNCLLDFTEGKDDGMSYDNMNQFYKQLGTLSKQDPNYNTKNQNSNLFINVNVKEGNEPNQDMDVGNHFDCAQDENEVQTNRDELLNNTVKEANNICSQANNGGDCGTGFSQQEHNDTSELLDIEECAAATRGVPIFAAPEILTKTKEDAVQQLSATEILTQIKKDLVEQLDITEELTLFKDDPEEKWSVTAILTPAEEVVVEPVGVLNFVKHSESETKGSICEDSFAENVADHFQGGDTGKQCKDNGNVPLAEEEAEHLETTNFVECKRKEDGLEQSVYGYLEERQDFVDAEICPEKTEENIEKSSDEVQRVYDRVINRNCQQILGDDINCNVIVRNNVDGKEISTAVENEAYVNRNKENHEASTSDLSSSSEISEIDKVQEESATTEMSEKDKIHQDCTTNDLEKVFSQQVSDSVSIASTDSGQGSCEIEPETFFASTSYPLPPQEYIFYEFVIPQVLVGRLIGKRGAMVNKIRAQTDAHLIILPHSVNRKYKICSVEGTREQVDAALDMIRKHFPLSRYPDVTLERVNQQPCTQSLEACFNAATLQLELPAGVVSEVQVCSIMSPCQFFVHLPLHPSHGNLTRLLHCMNTNYADGSTTPALPQPVSAGTVCAALVSGQWQRCMVVSCEENCCSVNLLDLGGFMNIPIENLRQIRSDYLTLPFQAAQCLLHGVNSTTESWSDTTYAAFEELVSDSILFATVVAYTQEGIPFVNLYRRENDEYVSISEKLVELGHAKWVASVGMVA